MSGKRRDWENTISHNRLRMEKAGNTVEKHFEPIYYKTCPQGIKGGKEKIAIVCETTHDTRDSRFGVSATYLFTMDADRLCTRKYTYFYAT